MSEPPTDSPDELTDSESEKATGKATEKATGTANRNDSATRTIEPMLSKPVASIPEAPGWHFEPKWDGFRAIVFKEGDEVQLQSRDLKPMARYFPELLGPLRAALPERCILDGEVVIAGARGLDFDALLLRIHPAASRIKLLAAQTPASFVAWDLLSLGAEDLQGAPLAERRQRLESLFANATPPAGPSTVRLTPVTTDRALAEDWFRRFEGAGLDGVIAKRLDEPYRPGERGWLKIKHTRTADCVVAGFRWHKNGPGTLVGSLLLGLHDASGRLHHVGVTSSFTTEKRRALAVELAPLVVNVESPAEVEAHPWQWAFHGGEEPTPGEPEPQRRPGATSRWNRGKDLSFVPLRIERTCEVAYDHLQGNRFRHATTFQRWRPDKPPADCRYDQLEATAPYELARIFGKE